MTPVYRLAAAALLLAVAACSQSPSPGLDVSANLTSQAFGTPQDDEILALASYSGGVYAVGSTRGSLYAANEGSGDIIVTKVGSDKRTVWSRQFGTPGLDWASHVATDAGGNVYVFGSTGGRLARDLRGASDFFLRKYSASGGIVWTLQFGLETGDYPVDLVTTGNSVYVVGESSGKGYFLYRFNLNSSIWWKRQIRVPNTLSGQHLTLDRAGNVYAAGEVEGVYEPDIGTNTDIRLLKFSGAGAPLWDRTYDYSYDDSVYELIAQGDSVFLLGGTYEFADDDSSYTLYRFSGNGDRNWGIYLGPANSNDLKLNAVTTLHVDGSGLYTDTFIRYDRTFRPDPDERLLKRFRFDGSLAWERDWTALGGSTAVAERGAGEVYVGGYDGDGNTPATPNDAYLLKLNVATGATVWSK